MTGVLIAAATVVVQPTAGLEAAVDLGDGLVATVTPVHSEPAATAGVRDLACISAQRCIAADTRPVRTFDGGLTWQLVPPPASGTTASPAMSSVECSGDRCIAIVESLVVTTTDLGSTWQPGVLPPAVIPVDGLSCPTADVCRARGQTSAGVQVMLASDDGGATWRSAPSQQVTDSKLACASGTFCVLPIYGSGVSRSLDGGQTWSLVPGVPSVMNGGASCPAATVCVVGGSGGWAVVTTTTATWSDAAPDTWFSQVVACTSTTRCVLVGQDSITRLPEVIRVDTATGLVEVGAMPDAAGGPEAIDCMGSTCVVAGQAGLTSGITSQPAATSVTADAGAVWTAVLATNASGSVRALACTSAGTCLAVGDTGRRSGPPLLFVAPSEDADGRILRSTDQGRTWSPVAVPTGTRGIMSVGCTEAVCVAAAQTDGTNGWMRMLRSADDGVTWSVVTVSRAMAAGEWASVECLPDACFTAITEFSPPRSVHLLRSDANGENWVARSSFTGVRVALTCVDSDRCLRTATAGILGLPQRTVDGGATWTPVSAPNGEFALSIAGCVPGRCYATGFPGRQYSTDDLGATWRSMPSSSPLASVLATACAPGRCYAVSANAIAVASTSTGPMSTLSFREAFGSSSVVKGFECPSIDVCLIARDVSFPRSTVIDRIAVTTTPIIAIAPARLLDTRPGRSTVDGAHAGSGIRAPGSTYVLPVRGRGTVGSNANAATMTVTVTEPVGPGFVTVYPCDRDRPNASNVNVVSTGQTIANAVTVPFAANGTVCIYTSTAMHLAVDANAYMSTVSPTITPVAPARLLETRAGADLTTVDGASQGTGAFAAGETRPLDVRGRGGVPTDAASVTLNVGAVDPTADGYLTVFPCGTAPPNASNVNFRARRTASNAVTVPISDDGTVCIYSLAATQVIVDVTAFATRQVVTVRSVTPARLLDTRAGSATVDGQMSGVGRPGDRQRIVLPIATRGGVPVDARTVTLTLTATDATGPGYLTVSPCTLPAPVASNLNYGAGDTVANAVTVPLTDSGTVCIDVLTSTDVIVDVNAYSV